MGGERASTVRRRQAGKICCTCETILSSPEQPGERYCDRCDVERAPRRRIYMSFQLRDGWCCQFLEPDLKTSLPRRVSFPTPDALLKFAKRGGCLMMLEDRQAFENGVAIGRGGLWLNLTASQYAKVK